MVTSEHLEFGPFVVDSGEGLLLLGGSPVELRPKAFSALRTLIRSNGHYVPYDQMIRDAWDGVFVSRHTVAVTIAEVKKALGEYGSWITHRPKIGYRLEIPGSEELIREGWHCLSRATRQGLEKALECFQNAVSQDVSDHRGYEGKAVCYLSLATYGMRPVKEMYEGFLEAHHHAVELCGLTPELRGERGHALHIFERNFPEAERELLRALRDKPRWSGVYVRLAMVYATEGRFEDALEIIERSRIVEPLNAAVPPAEVFIRLCQQDLAAALAAGQRGVELHPYQPLGRALFAQALESSGRVEDALREFQLAHLMSQDLHWLRVFVGVCLAKLGRQKEAIEIVDAIQKTRQTEYIDAYFVALLYETLRQRDLAMKELERAVDENSATLFLLDVDPRMNPLRQDPRFQPLRDRAFPGRSAPFVARA
jgi:tetratricopeptide (TPR) repeat protein